MRLPMQYLLNVYFTHDHVLRLENAQNIHQFQGLVTHEDVKSVLFGSPYVLLEGDYRSFVLQRDNILYTMIQRM